MNIQTATLAAGCFWCVEAVFDDLNGVQSVESGYMGGKTVSPTYAQICDGDTGHAEIIQIKFDADVVSFRELLEVFFTIHDPTTLNRQGNDVGTQYRSAIFYHSPEQKQIAGETIAEFNGKKLWSKSIATEVVPASTFYIAEDYHQEYFARTGNANPYCSMVVAPKVAKFRKQFVDKLKR